MVVNTTKPLSIAMPLLIHLMRMGKVMLTYLCLAAHRAVVDVDEELDRSEVEIATSQDVGRVLNPVQARGQIEGGSRRV